MASALQKLWKVLNVGGPKDRDPTSRHQSCWIGRCLSSFMVMFSKLLLFFYWLVSLRLNSQYADWFVNHEVALSSALFRGRILGRNWDKSLRSFPPCLFTVTSTDEFYPPTPQQKLSCSKLADITLYTETSSLRTLKIMPRTLNEIVSSWIHLLDSVHCKEEEYRSSYIKLCFDCKKKYISLYPVHMHNIQECRLFCDRQVFRCY